MSDFIKVNIRIGNFSINPEDLEKREYNERLGLPQSDLESEVSFIDDHGYIRKDSITSIIGMGDNGTEITCDGQSIMTTNTIEEIYKMICGYVTYKRD